MEFTKLDYCQYLLSSQVNYTLTNLAEHLDQFSHDTINRYLKGEKLSPRLLFEQVEGLLERDSDAYLIFDDTVLDKNFGPEIEPTRYQWSGNAKDVIRGIGVVSCVYVSPKTEHFWVIDYRIFDPDTDGLTKIDHVRQMLGSVAHRRLPYSTVLMDTWYATKELMLLIEEAGKTFYCPLKVNRRVDDSGGDRPYQRADSLDWSEQELELGKLVKVKGFPGDYKLKLFRVVVNTNRTEWIVSNDLSRDSVRAAQKARRLRWRIEELPIENSSSKTQYHRDKGKCLEIHLPSTRLHQGRRSTVPWDPLEPSAASPGAVPHPPSAESLLRSSAPRSRRSPLSSSGTRSRAAARSLRFSRLASRSASRDRSRLSTLARSSSSTAEGGCPGEPCRLSCRVCTASTHTYTRPSVPFSASREPRCIRFLMPPSVVPRMRAASCTVTLCLPSVMPPS